MAKSIFTGAVDRVEGKTAVIIAENGEDAVELPASLLPAGAAEGDIVQIRIEKKDKKTREEKDKIRGMIKRLSL